MPSYTVVVKDTSPILSYRGTWLAGSSRDGLADQYLQSTFTLTETSGDTMSMQFFGSAVTIIGAKRGNHGNYQVQVDTAIYPPATGASNQELFNQTLFSASLATGLHNLTLTNSESKFFDVDYVSFDTSIGTPSEELIVNTFHATHPSFVYSPSSAWAEPGVVGAFTGSSGRATADPSASAAFTFQGKGHSALNWNPPLILQLPQVDQGPVFPLSAQKTFRKPRELLFYTGNLGRGTHTLRIGLQSGISGALVIESADVYTTPSFGGSFGTPVLSSNSSVGGTSSTLPQKIPTSAIAGLVVLGVVAVVAILGCLYLVWRLRRALKEVSKATSYTVQPNTLPSQSFVVDGGVNPQRGYSNPQIGPSTSQIGYSVTQLHPPIQPAIISQAQPFTYVSSSTATTSSASNYSSPASRVGYNDRKRRPQPSSSHNLTASTEVRSGSRVSQSLSEAAPPEYS
ncbi:unnamed protein product [Cyclocybe aegerita]|uniref:Transmembrane protein n=1 Tax=Cyclocybe aegerita TaxID=1973307 RepID=A0A8S0VTL2_CYCAE|nr:unnamed protein product [Cyclocybe aegerita]